MRRFNFTLKWMFYLNLILCSTVLAQFSLVNTIPADGTVNVDVDSAMISITFSDTVDTTADFDGFYLSIEFNPDDILIESEDITISDDGKTLSVTDLDLTEDTKYTMLLSGAVSVKGDSLDRPYIVTFTTATEMPPHKVDGQITYPDGSPLNTVVVLIDVESEEFDLSSGIVVTAADGSFSIPYVKPGEYYMVAIQDVNGDGMVDLAPGDAVGIYDQDLDGVMDIITVNGDVTGLDVTLNILSAVTAGNHLNAVNTLASEWSNDAELAFVISEEMDELGKAIQWIYFYYSESLDSFNLILNMGPVIVSGGIDEASEGIIPLPASWIDSDAAMAVAEANGGSDFRAAYPDCEIGAILGFSMTGFDNGGGYYYYKNPPTSRPSHSSFLNTIKSIPAYKVQSLLNVDIDPYWSFNYYSDSEWEDIDIYVNAIDGTLFDGYTAEEAVQMTNSILKTINNDAVLISVNGLEVNTTGKAGTWLLDYYSASTNIVSSFFTSGPMLLDRRSGPADETPVILPQTWKDSDEIFTIADNAGAKEFRTRYPDWAVDMYLGVNIVDMLWGMGFLKSAEMEKSMISQSPMLQNLAEENDTSVQAWLFYIYSDSLDENEYYLIDAATGELYGPVSAKTSADKAYEVVKDKADDLVLAGCISEMSLIQSLDSFGSIWQHIYYSPSKDSIYMTNVFDGYMVEIQTWPAYMAYTELPDGWIDSDQALQIAESRGGKAFREKVDYFHLTCYVGSDGAGLFGLETGETPIWYFDYWDGAFESVEIIFDAMTGDTLTPVEYRTKMPKHFSLSQNYPNPFNPSTEFQYEVPHTSPVQIRVINLMGKEVNVLINEEMQSGSYTIQWNGMNQNKHPVSSGIYFLEMTAGSERFIRKMSLIR